MKKLLLILGAVVLLLIVAAIAIPFLIPVEKYKSELTAQVKAATGRDLMINGPLSFSVFPNLTLKAGDVTFSNAPGAREANMLTLEELALSVKLMPLLSGNLEIDGFKLVKPVIHLEIDKNGKANWDFDNAGQADKAANNTNSGLSDVIEELKLGDVRLVDGRLTYRDLSSDVAEEFDNINVEIKLPNFDGPFALNGNLVWKAEKVDIEFKTDNLEDFIEGKQQPVVARINSAPVKLSLDGTGQSAESLKLAGKVNLNVPSVRKLAEWVGTPLDMPGSGLGPLQIEGNLDLSENHYKFSDASVSLDNIRANGTVEALTGGDRIKIKGALSTGVLDLNPYLPEETAETTTGWSKEPIDLSGLKAVDLDIAFKTSGIVYRKITIGESALDLKLVNGVLTAALKDMNLYEGRGNGTIMVDASRSTPNVNMTFNLANVNAEPLLVAANDFDRLSGRLSTNFKVNTHGASQYDLVSALSGDGKVTFKDGTLKGVDVAKVAEVIEKISNGFKSGGADMLSSLTSGNLLGSIQSIATMFGGKGESNAETKFTSLDAVWTANNGTINNSNMELVGPLVNQRALFKMNGHGTVNLAKEVIDYTAEIRSFAKAESGTGVGGTVKLTGSLNDPNACVVLGSICVGKGTKPGDLLKQGLKDNLKDKLLGGDGEGEEGKKPSLDKLKEGFKGLKLKK